MYTPTKTIGLVLVCATIIGVIFIGEHFLNRRQGRLLSLTGHGVCQVTSGEVRFVHHGKPEHIMISGNGDYSLPVALKSIILHVNLQANPGCIKGTRCSHASYQPQCRQIHLNYQPLTRITFNKPNTKTVRCQCQQS